MRVMKDVLLGILFIAIMYGWFLYCVPFIAEKFNG